MQTAIKWLLQELEKVNYHPTEAMIMYAKKLEKQQIIDAYVKGFCISAEGFNGEYGINDFNNIKEEISAEQYYTSTYGSKVSNDQVPGDKKIEDKIENMLGIIERLIEKMDEMENKLDRIREMIDNISSEKIIDDAVTSMREKWDTTTEVSWDTQTK